MHRLPGHGPQGEQVEVGIGVDEPLGRAGPPGEPDPPGQPEGEHDQDRDRRDAQPEHEGQVPDRALLVAAGRRQLAGRAPGRLERRLQPVADERDPGDLVRRAAQVALRPVPADSS